MAPLSLLQEGNNMPLFSHKKAIAYAVSAVVLFIALWTLERSRHYDFSIRAAAEQKLAKETKILLDKKRRAYESNPNLDFDFPSINFSGGKSLPGHDVANTYGHKNIIGQEIK